MRDLRKANHVVIRWRHHTTGQNLPSISATSRCLPVAANDCACACVAKSKAAVSEDELTPPLREATIHIDPQLCLLVKKDFLLLSDANMMICSHACASATIFWLAFLVFNALPRALSSPIAEPLPLNTKVPSSPFHNNPGYLSMNQSAIQEGETHCWTTEERPGRPVASWLCGSAINLVITRDGIDTWKAKQLFYHRSAPEPAVTRRTHEVPDDWKLDAGEDVCQIYLTSLLRTAKDEFTLQDVTIAAQRIINDCTEGTKSGLGGYAFIGNEKSFFTAVNGEWEGPYGHPLNVTDTVEAAVHPVDIA